jgi:predicted nicotinamide N-methyase
MAILSDLSFDIASDSTASHRETTMRIVLRDNTFANHEAQADESDTIDRKAKRSRRSRSERKEQDEGFVPSDKRILTIVTTGETPLDLVGCQLWRGALLIADLLIAKRKELCDQEATVVELGCGVGLLGVVCRLVTSQVSFVTDKDEGGILNLAQRNLQVNAHLEPLKGVVAVRAAAASDGHNPVRIRKLDWLTGDPQHVFPQKTSPLCNSTSNSSSNNNNNTCHSSENTTFPSSPSSSPSPFSWTPEELSFVGSSDRKVVVLVADCVYDETLTDALFECLRAIFKRHPRGRCFLSLEKRYNFEVRERQTESCCCWTLQPLNSD